MKACFLFLLTAFFLQATTILHGEVKIDTDHNRSQDATAEFKFKRVPRPSQGDAAAQAKFIIVDGRGDANGGDAEKLHDDQIPTNDDQPSGNFFFRAGTAGGRIMVDLGRVIDMKQVNTYSWHSDTRGPQVYQLYASEGKTDNFNAQPKQGTDPTACGWKPIGKVDTRPAEGEGGGQYGVSILDTTGSLGKYQYLLFDIARTEDRDPFGNTFYGEIDVIDRNAPAPQAVTPPVAGSSVFKVEAGDGKYEITIDTSSAPDLTDPVKQKLVPVIKEWYPKLVQMLPSEGFEAPRRFSILFDEGMQGVAATSGTRIRVAARWFRQNLAGESIGSVVHEMVHVVQQYGRGRRASRPPGWLVEGITDYIRWFHFEPQSHGAEITRRNISRARYDGSYRITANFLNWITVKYDKNFVWKLNAAIREGRYSEDYWKAQTSHTVAELGAEWKASLEKQIAADAGNG